MKIAPRTVALFLPLVLAPLFLLTYLSTTAANEGITAAASSLLRFKTEELLRFADGQYRLLQETSLADSPEMVKAAEATIASYASGLIREEDELVLALSASGEVAFMTAQLPLGREDKDGIAALARRGEGWREFELAGRQRVAFVAFFPPFSWTIFISQARDSFFLPVRQLTLNSIILAAAAAAVALVLLIVFSRLLTGPIRHVADSMREVISTGDLGRKVSVPYDDEIGELGDAFNGMTEALEQAYGEIKNYALDAALARKREAKIRNIFQKYVPKQVIDRFFASPESMLTGEDRKLAILFSDIRGFTAFSETMSSREVVSSLNDYFSRMVEAVIRYDGIVDKYIGDALMAFFGAPVADEASASHALESAFAMLEELAAFNESQRGRGKSPIAIGIGINYGSVTIGNIGSDKKMDYTVIGDMVNLTSRLEGLTKYYREPIIVSESIKRFVAASVPCRMIDRVQVKGRSKGLAIYAVRRALAEAEERAWKLHDRALQAYYNRDFSEALELFELVRGELPGDAVSGIFADRCKAHIAEPPPPGWSGLVAHTEK